MTWRLWRRRHNGDAAAAAEQRAKLRAAERQTPTYERMAGVLAELPPEELADRLRRAMTVRPT